MTVVDAERELALIEAIELIEAEERELCATHPAYLIDRMYAVDEREAEDDIATSIFHFDVLTEQERRDANRTLVAFFGEDEAGWPDHLGWRAKNGRWFWQREVIDWWIDNRRTIALKARQLGITWNACGYTGWTALYKPGSNSLHYRQKEEDAHDNVRCTWELLASLPRHLWNDAVLEKPARVTEPIATEELRFRFPDGRASRIRAQTSASESGHGGRAAVVVLDEFSRIEKAGGIIKAANSAVGKRGKMLIISTANGRSNEETGGGNRFHLLWTKAKQMGFATKFLPWSLHPDRDQDWYDHDDEVRALLPHERAEQYPANEHEAFALTNKVYYDPEDLNWYSAEAVREPLYHFDFVEPAAPEKLARGPKAKVRRHDKGGWAMLREPEEGHSYAIFADVASGHGRDYSAAYVIDLTDQALCAEFHNKISEDLYAAQLHYIGRWYGRVGSGASPADPDATGYAKLAVETQGGFGNAVIAPLRDKTAGRPAYGNLYRHVLDNRGDKPIAKPYGFPMNTATRPKAVNALGKALRERTLPWVTAGLIQEIGDFVHHDHGTSPRAAEGLNDDRVMAVCGALELYRLYGHHAEKHRRKHSRRPFKHWLQAA